MPGSVDLDPDGSHGWPAQMQVRRGVAPHFREERAEHFLLRYGEPSASNCPIATAWQTFLRVISDPTRHVSSSQTPDGSCSLVPTPCGRSCLSHRGTEGGETSQV